MFSRADQVESGPVPSTVQPLPFQLLILLPVQLLIPLPVQLLILLPVQLLILLPVQLLILLPVKLLILLPVQLLIPLPVQLLIPLPVQLLVLLPVQLLIHTTMALTPEHRSAAQSRPFLLPRNRTSNLAQRGRLLIEVGVVLSLRLNFALKIAMTKFANGKEEEDEEEERRKRRKGRRGRRRRRRRRTTCRSRRKGKLSTPRHQGPACPVANRSDSMVVRSQALHTLWARRVRGEARITDLVGMGERSFSPGRDERARR